MILELGKRGTQVLEAKGRENLLDRLLYNAKKKKKLKRRQVIDVLQIFIVFGH